MTAIAIRDASPGDAEAVRVLLREAFDGPAEASLVEELRATGEIELEQIAIAGREIVGYVGYARLAVSPTSPMPLLASRVPRSSSSSAKAEDPGLLRKEAGSSALAEDDEPSPSSARDDTEESATRIVALAPLAVAAAWRRRRIGAALVQGSLDELRARGCDLVLVLGNPAYYGRFGFIPAAGFDLRTPYDGPYQQALALSERGRSVRGLHVTYPEAFAAVE